MKVSTLKTANMLDFYLDKSRKRIICIKYYSSEKDIERDKEPSHVEIKYPKKTNLVSYEKFISELPKISKMDYMLCILNHFPSEQTTNHIHTEIMNGAYQKKGGIRIMISEQYEKLQQLRKDLVFINDNIAENHSELEAVTHLDNAIMFIKNAMDRIVVSDDYNEEQEQARIDTENENKIDYELENQ